MFSLHLPFLSPALQTTEMKTCSLFWGSSLQESVLEPRREPKAAGSDSPERIEAGSEWEGPLGKQAGAGGRPLEEGREGKG